MAGNNPLVKMDSSPYKNAKKYFITAKEPTDLLTLLKKNLPKNTDPKTLLSAGGIWLQNKRVTQNQVIAAGETLKVYRCKTQAQRFQIHSDAIRYETPDFMAVFKPAGISTVPDRSHLFYNLTAGVADYYKSCGNTYVPTAINRLDLMVQGLVLFAKNKPAEKKLFKLFATRKIGKAYHAALDLFSSPPARITIHESIKIPNNDTIIAKKKPASTTFIFKGTKAAQAHFYTVIPHTGRRHQIRIHAAHHLAPIIGDQLYGSKTETPRHEIALIACGYNIPWHDKKHRIRLQPDSVQKIIAPLLAPK